jgi:hypothetical protein
MPFLNRKRLARLVAAAASLLAWSSPAAVAQDTTAFPAVADSAAAAPQLLRVFFDCQTFWCSDFDFVRTEIPFVNWMRDRFDSEVHVLVTGTRNGSGAVDFSMIVLGRKQWDGQADTLRISTLPNDAEDVIRRKLVRAIRVGLVRYVAQTPLADRLRIALDGPAMAAPTPATVRDPWNFWIFTVGADGSANLESRQDEENLRTNFTATRVTEDWRIGLGASGSYQGRAFELTPGQPRTSFVNRAGDVSLYAVRSLDRRWSAGLLANAGFSDFLNEALLVRAQPAIEYNVFPWSEVVRRQLSFMYSAGAIHFRWQRPTIFGVERSETRPVHKVIATLSQRQTWGTLQLTLQGQQFLHDPTKYNLRFTTFTNLRLGKGLQLNVRGTVARVRDQLYLPADGLTDEQILVRQQALATDFNVNLNVGLSYTFGSIYNTVVNRRLDALLGFGRGLSSGVF